MITVKVGELVSVWNRKDYYKLEYTTGLVLKKEEMGSPCPLMMCLILIGDVAHWYNEDSIMPTKENQI